MPLKSKLDIHVEPGPQQIPFLECLGRPPGTEDLPQEEQGCKEPLQEGSILTHQDWIEGHRMSLISELRSAVSMSSNRLSRRLSCELRTSSVGFGASLTAFIRALESFCCSLCAASSSQRPSPRETMFTSSVFGNCSLTSL
mmetsp:Transcript_45320/g.176072  ORF Transcript_45320/g.176072 Transcript_45320/m.176072 type:complete len:141 (+) Transcript_45320:2261-2683(+)